MATAASRRFSSRGSALLATLAVVAALLAVLAIATSSRGGEDEERAAVARYIHDLNALQGTRVEELDRMERTYERLRLDSGDLEGEAADLGRAERTLRELRAAVETLEPPAEAERLHRDVLGLLELQASFAAEVAAMVRYLPRLAEQESALVAATDRLREDLDGADTRGEQNAAFGRYATALGAVADELEELRAPAVLEPSRTGDVERLRRLVGNAQRLQAAVRRGDSAAVQRLYAELGREASRAGASSAERRAVVAYNDRLREIGDRRLAVDRERARLDADSS